MNLPNEAKNRFNNPFISLRHKNFRYYWMGMCVSLIINSISFAAVVISLFFIKLKPVDRKPNCNTNVLEEIKDGLRYIYHKNSLLYTVIVLAIIGTFAPNFNVLVPVFAKEILKQDEAGFGILMSFLGFGSFLGAMFIAALSKSGPKKSVLYIVPLIVGIALIITGYTNSYLLMGIFLSITGFFFIAFTSSANSTLQLNSSNEYRGRVMSVYTLVFSGTTPLGNLYAGLFAEHFNARVGFAACGAMIIVLMIPLYIHKRINKVI